MLTSAPAPETERLAQFCQARASHPYLSELIEGAIILGGSPRLIHQILVARLYQLLLAHIPDGVLLFAPMDVHLDEANIVQPDLFWVADQGQSAALEDGFHGPPDLVVEVLSPSTAKRDLTAKYRLYERVGVREYWIVDADNRYIAVHSRDETGRYALLDAYEAAESLASLVLGQAIALPPGLFDLPLSKAPTS